MTGARQKAQMIWCDYCNADISLAGIRGCIRQDCKTKALLPDARKVWK